MSFGFFAFSYLQGYLQVLFQAPKPSVSISSSRVIFFSRLPFLISLIYGFALLLSLCHPNVLQKAKDLTLLNNIKRPKLDQTFIESMISQFFDQMP